MKNFLITSVCLSMISFVAVCGGGDAKTIDPANIPISVFGGGDALEQKIISNQEGGGDA